jgi:hypothetical protein
MIPNRLQDDQEWRRLQECIDKGLDRATGPSSRAAQQQLDGGGLSHPLKKQEATRDVWMDGRASESTRSKLSVSTQTEPR